MISKYYLIFGVVSGFLCLHFVEVDPFYWKSSVSGKFGSRKHEIFKLLTDLNRTPDWLPIVINIQGLDNRKLSAGKRFRTLLDISILGQTNTTFVMSSYKEGSKAEIRSNRAYLRPVFSFQLSEFSKKKKSGTKVQFEFYLNNRSGLIQCTLGPIVWFLSRHQFQHSLLMIRWLVPQDN